MRVSVAARIKPYGSKEKIERNNRLVKRYVELQMDGVWRKVPILREEFNLSKARIYEILNWYKY